MSDFSNIPRGLNIQTQIPLDVKLFKINETSLADLGENDNLAYTYYDGLKIYCFEEKTTYIWREVQPGEENTGLISSDFTYPNNVVTFGVDYSNKVYNFFKIKNEINIENVGDGEEILKNFENTPEGKTYNLRTLKASTIGSNGVSPLVSLSQNTDDISLIIRLINSNSLILSVGNDGELNIELPSTSTIPALYVNDLYTPTYNDWLAENKAQNGGTAVTGFVFRGKGTLAQPFTDSVVYPLAGGSATVTFNTAIENALDGDSAYAIPYSYVGSTTLSYSRLNPQRNGQQIIVQNNNNEYIYDGDFNYSYLNLLNQGVISCTTTNYLVDMDNSLYFNPQTSQCIITNDKEGVIKFKKGFLNSGNTISTTTYSTGRILYLNGGEFQEYQSYNSNNTFILNSDPENNVNGTTGCNNDGNLCIICTDTKLRSVNNGIYKIGGKSKIEFNNCELISNDVAQTVNSNLISFYNLGGIIRLFNSKVFLGGITGRLNAFVFSPVSAFQSNSQFIVRNTQFMGSSTTWFNKTNNFSFSFDVISCNTLFFNGSQLFNSTNLWHVNFNNNVFEQINIDFTKVDFTQGNNKSSINTIGNNIIEQLVKYSSRAIAAGILPVGSAFINTNGSSITTPLPTWTRDIVI